MGRQHDLLELLEPSPALTPAMRTAAIPMLAALLLEVATNPHDEHAGWKDHFDGGRR